MSSLLFCLFLAMQEQKDTVLNDLVKKNKDHFELIKTISAEIDATISFDGGKSWEKMEKLLWQRTATSARFKYALYGAFAEGWERISDFGDSYSETKESWGLKGFNPDAPPKLPITPGTPEFAQIKGFITPPPAPENIRKNEVYFWLLFNPDFSHSLFELSKLNSEIKLVGLVDVEGKKLWELRFRQDGRDFTIFLDPKANFAICKRLVDVPDKGQIVKTSYSVLKFQEFPGGIFIPTHVRNTSKDPYDDVVDIKVTNLKVNEQIDEDSLKVSFPEGIYVLDTIRDKIYIWGKDGPRLEFSSKNKDFQNWLGTQVSQTDMGMVAFIAINVVLVCLVVVVVLIRRRRRRRAAVAGTGAP